MEKNQSIANKFIISNPDSFLYFEKNDTTVEVWGAGIGFKEYLFTLYDNPTTTAWEQYKEIVSSLPYKLS